MINIVMDSFKLWLEEYKENSHIKKFNDAMEKKTGIKNYHHHMTRKGLKMSGLSDKAIDKRVGKSRPMGDKQYNLGKPKHELKGINQD